MAVSGKPRAMAARGEVVPDRAAMEAWAASVTAEARVAALDRAQAIVEYAWGKASSRGRRADAWEALSITPLCADAYSLLVQLASPPAEAVLLYTRAIEAATLVLGPDAFDRFDGAFWSFPQTRPYMRARRGLALTLERMGDAASAIEHFQAMLMLDADDHLRIRYLLLATLLRRNDVAGIEALLAEFPDDKGVFWLYTRAFLLYRANRAFSEETMAVLRQARTVNRHVAGMLAGTTPEVEPRGSAFRAGSVDAATEYVRACGEAWRRHLGSIAWLGQAMDEGLRDGKVISL